MVYTNSSSKKTLDSNNLWRTCISIPASTSKLQPNQFEYQTCGRFLSDPLSLENALSQKTLISLFSELVVRSVPVKLSADLSHRFLEKQNITTCGHKSISWVKALLSQQEMHPYHGLMTKVLFG